MEDQRFQDAFEHSGAALAITDDSDTLIEASPALCDLVEVAHDALLGRRFASLFVPAAHPALRRMVEDDGRRFEVRSRSTGLGAVHHVVDVTSRVDAEKLTAEVALERRRLADAGDLLASVAHDLGNALAVLKLHAQLVLLHPELPSEVREQVTEMELHSDLAHDLVTEVVGYARAGQPELVSSDLRELLERMVPVLRRMVPPGVSIDHGPPPPGCEVPVDPGRLHQILLNLVSNAADAMPEGGVVSVQCRPVTDPAPGVLLTVGDTGGGMEPDVRARAFEPFFSTKARGAGTGLGLPQVGRLVADHGGTVRLHSTVGEGTTAEIWLPRC